MCLKCGTPRSFKTQCKDGIRLIYCKDCGRVITLYEYIFRTLDVKDCPIKNHPLRFSEHDPLGKQLCDLGYIGRW